MKIRNWILITLACFITLTLGIVTCFRFTSISYSQKAKKLAHDIVVVPEMNKLQPWAIDIMERFKAGQVKTNVHADLWWTTNAFKLEVNEMPDFIGRQWGFTNKFGEVWPEIAIVIDDGHPYYLVVDWGDEWGVVVGERQYRVSFNPIGSIAVAPGIYTYYGEH
jgi:hypothetical protein